MKIQASTDVDATRPDGIIGFYEKTNGEERDHRAVIELKGPQIPLDKDQKRKGTTYKSPVDQAFSYTNKLDRCRWVIVSNFTEIRLYQVGRSKEHYEIFYLNELDDINEFKKFHYLISKNNLISKDGKSQTTQLTEATQKRHEDISVEFYNLYKNARVNLFEHLKDNNEDIELELLLEKAQKFLDRIIFICFCEDKGLLPNDLLHNAIKRAKESFAVTDTEIWREIKGVFRAIDKGATEHNINAFDGGLFKDDEVLDNLEIKNDFFEVVYDISDYDFDSDVDVNILGHIFEQSITDIEKLKSDIKENEYDKNQSRRKKEGIYYTPRYITSYIVENAVGGYLEDIKEDMGYYDLPDIEEAGSDSWKTRYTNQHLKFYNNYEEKLKNIKILDPACGSGAFLNQAFDYLLQEHKWLNKQRDLLKGGQSSIFAVEALQRTILKNNLFGVDLNEESVEITKLSLWLKTANKRRPLTNLDENIICGNSLINDPKIAGEKAFNWKEEFSDIMDDGGFDVVIGNPPYVDNRGYDKFHLKYLFDHYNSLSKSGTNKFKTTKFNTFVPFIEKLSFLLKEEGCSGYILHKNVLKTTSYRGIRKFILENFHIEKIVDWGAGQFENVTAETISLFLKKVKEKNSIINIDFFKGSNQIDENSIKQKHYTNTYDYIFSINLNEQDVPLITKIENIAEFKLFELVNINNGIVTGNDDKYIYKTKSNKFDKVCVTGKNIDKYEITGIKGYLNYDKENLLRPRNQKIFEAQEKLIMQMISLDLVLAYDNSQLYNLGTTYAITTKNDKCKLKFILGLLNSNLLNYYYLKKFTNKSSLTNAVSTKNLYELPIIINKSINNTNITVYANKMINLKTKIKNKNKISFENMLYEFVSKKGKCIINILNNSNFYNKIYSGRARKVRNLTVNINANIVTFYSDKSGSGKYELLKFEEDDEYKRRYLKYYLENLTEKQLEGINENHSGNLLKRVLQIEIPDYDKNQVVRKVVDEWESLQQKIKELEDKIEKTDNEIDQMVYELYNLTDEEIKIVEEGLAE